VAEERFKKYGLEVKAQTLDSNSSLNPLETSLVNVQQFFGGTGFFISRIFQSTSLTPYVQNVYACAQCYDIAEVHYSRFPEMFEHLVSRQPPEEQNSNIKALIHPLAKFKEKYGMTAFLLLTQPSSYSKGRCDYADVLELYQRLVYLHDHGRIHDSLMEAMRKFHLAEIDVHQLLASVIKAECQQEEETSPTSCVGSHGFSPTLEGLCRANIFNWSHAYQVERILEVMSWHNPNMVNASSSDNVISTIAKAKGILNEQQFSALLNPISYEHVVDISLLSTAVRLMGIVFQGGGYIDGELELFRAARLSLSGLIVALEGYILGLSIAASTERNLDEVLKGFESLTPDELFSMKREYLAICRIGEELLHKSVDELVAQAKTIRSNCLNAPLTAKDSRILLAVARESIRKEFGIYPYETQMLAILGLIGHPENVKGRIAQVLTGEGKSAVIAMLALYQACQGRCVDIVSSSRYLSQRDQEKFARYFDRFGLSSSHLCTDSPTEKNFCGQILFATNFDFEFALMRDFFRSKPMRTIEVDGKKIERPFHVVIVDEVDNLFVDSALNSARIAISGRMATREIYAPIFQFVQERREKIQSLLKHGCFVNSPEWKEVSRIVLESLQTKNRPAEVDAFQSFWPERLQMLIHSALIALDYEEGREYLIKTAQSSSDQIKKSIVIIDQSNGRLAERSRWSHGLHQFLEIKHDIVPEEEHVTPCSVCHPVYFQKYSHIYGLSGTIGAEIEKLEVHKTYSIQSFAVPPHKPCRRQDLDPIICPTHEQHYSKIVNEIRSMVSAGRPTLILFESIQDAERFASFCTEEKLSYFLLTERQAEEESFVIARAGTPGSITIATNTAGRGTDIPLQKDSLCGGGLHVIFTYLPDNERVERQGIGRAGRQGQPGSSRLILFHSEALLYPLLLALRNVRVESLSVARRTRTLVERVNHRYLSVFVQQFQAWTVAVNDQFLEAIARLHPDAYQKKEEVQALIQQEWAEKFYTILDQVLYSAKKKYEQDAEKMVSYYAEEVNALYESTKKYWERFLLSPRESLFGGTT
jgi:preprotein translocase subunit SecA